MLKKRPGETSKSCVYETGIYISFSQLSVQKSTKNSDEELSSIFGIEHLATQTNSKSGEDVSKIIVWVVEKSEKFAVKADIQLEKDLKLSNLYKVPSVFEVFIYFIF